MRPFFGRSKMSRVLSARARARARARPSCSTGASGPFDDRRLRSTTFRARATLVLLLYRTFFGDILEFMVKIVQIPIRYSHVFADDTKITCCSELRKWSPKTPFSGGVSCWHLPYHKGMCPQRTLKYMLKTKITWCSELWKWSPKTTLSGGVSCWHLPYQKSMCPQRTLKDT